MARFEEAGWGWHVRGRDYRLGGWMDVGAGVAVGERRGLRQSAGDGMSVDVTTGREVGWTWALVRRLANGVV